MHSDSSTNQNTPQPNLCLAVGIARMIDEPSDVGLKPCINVQVAAKRENVETGDAVLWSQNIVSDLEETCLATNELG